MNLNNIKAFNYKILDKNLLNSYLKYLKEKKFDSKKK